ncbi:uncharacterized protein LOC116730938 [Xiphophorus hellerii]|uniref:uncharacterized protein LOC116716607 n=1 Tax=Xiphophorus hellerii TaxID=8084 RepID=UPI0013B41F2F|nr:uncharacterized protein LOC116716607 [Xiphophorus hellerii]XP_032436400.1 uncharacterized protein LOC116730938 [Xiphophorus hellerii]
MASLLLLLHLLPPQPGGQKSPKISASDAVERLVVFHKSCCSLEEHLRGQQGLQPYLLAVGRQRSKIDSFYIVMDKCLIPCQTNGSLGAFDELFKAHFVNIVFSPILTMGMTIYLKHLIVEHHKLFKFLYSHRNLIPKHHFMIHYPSSIRKIGPLLHMWSMRFEAKHKMFIEYFKNFKNITKSLAKKHQMATAYHWETISIKENEHGPLKPFSLKDEDVVNKEMLQMISSGDVFSTSWVRVEGVEYRPGLAVCSTIQDEMPVFCQISDVLLVDNTFLLLPKQLFTETFDDHHHAFRIVQSEERHLVKKT